MGVVIYKRVVNMYDIPNDILVNCIGRGLTVNREGAAPVLELDVSAEFRFERNKLSLALGGGLCRDCDENLAVKPGRGIAVSPENEVEVRIGEGLAFTEDGTLVATVDDLTPDESKSEFLTMQIDSQLSIDAQRLTLVKTYQTVKFLKNTLGFSIGQEVVETFTKADDVILAVPYGYGGGCEPSYRPHTPDCPNFYVK